MENADSHTVTTQGASPCQQQVHTASQAGGAGEWAGSCPLLVHPEGRGQHNQVPRACATSINFIITGTGPWPGPTAHRNGVPPGSGTPTHPERTCCGSQEKPADPEVGGQQQQVALVWHFPPQVNAKRWGRHQGPRNASPQAQAWKNTVTRQGVGCRRERPAGTASEEGVVLGPHSAFCTRPLTLLGRGECQCWLVRPEPESQGSQ